jgi:hypothetical protein
VEEMIFDMDMWQSPVENVHYSGSQLLRKMRLKFGVIFAFLATFRYELRSLSRLLLPSPGPLRYQVLA